MSHLTIQVILTKMPTKVPGTGLVGRELDGLGDQTVKGYKRVATIVVADSLMNLQVDMCLCQVPSCFSFLGLECNGIAPSFGL
jgi:hypothetical protein